MDFNEINKININPQKIKKNKPENKKGQTSNAEKSNLKETPTNPSYWQNAVGIKKHNVSFGNNNSESNDFIDTQLKRIKCSFHWRKDEQALELKKNIMQELLPLGEKAVENYTTLIIYGLNNVWMDKEVERWENTSKDIVQIMPNMNEDNVKTAVSLIRNISTSRLTDEEHEKYKKIVEEILKKENVEDVDKLKWLNNLTEYTYRDKHEQIPSLEEVNESFSTYMQLKGLLSSEKDKEALLGSSLTLEEQKRIITLFEDEEIPNQDFDHFISGSVKSEYSWSSDPAVFLAKVTKDIETDKRKKDIFIKLIDYKNIGVKISPFIMDKIFEHDIDFVDETVSFLIDKKEQKNEKIITSDSLTLMKLFNVVNDSNIEDFKALTDEMPIDSAIYATQNYLNPKTNLFDKKIMDKIKELEELGVDSYDSRRTALASIDMKTGEFSPIAQEVIELFYPPQQKEKGIKGTLSTIKNSIKKAALPKVTRSLFGDEITGIIECLKNKDGEFEKSNLNYMYSLLRANRKVNSYRPVELYEIKTILENVKNSDGNIDRDKIALAIKLVRTFKSYQDAGNVLETLAKFPNEKQKEIYDTCLSIGVKPEKSYRNLPIFAKFCFDEEGNVKQDKLDLLKKLVETKDIIYDETFLKLIDENKKMETFLFDVIKLVDYSSILSYDLSKIIDEHKKEDGTLPTGLQTKILQHIKTTGYLGQFQSLYNSCLEKTDENSEAVLNEELFQKAAELLELERSLCLGNCNLTGEMSAKVIKQELSLKGIKFKERVGVLNSLKTIRDHLKETKPSEIGYLNKAISDIESSLTLENISLPITEETKGNFIRNVLVSTSKSNELTEFEKVMTNSIPELEMYRTGLPLSYSRESFLNDLNQICDSDEKIQILNDKAGINAVVEEQDGIKKITGYNGIIKLNELDQNNPVEKQIYDCMYNFMYNNQVVTGNNELDKQLNYIIKACPEFINTIGKKQHATHAYSVDVHSLLVLAHSISNPDYIEKLNALDKSLLKVSAIFHDIMKQEGVVDKGHQNLSSLYTRSIIKKIIAAPELQDRVFELIDNHHWTEEYSSAGDKELKAKELAYRFRRPNDFEIAKIMARSDLKSVNDEFYERLKSCLDEENIAPIQNNLDFLYSTGNALFTDKIVLPSKLKNHVETKDGKEYKVINLHKLKNDQDMGEFGFAKGKKKEDLRFLVHMVDENYIYNSLNTVKLLSSPLNGGVLSESLISPKYKRTYCNRKHGVLLSEINTNIINQNKSNQGSGTAKDFSNVMSLIYDGYAGGCRSNFKNELLKNLNIDSSQITDSEYAEFYKTVLASKTSLSEFCDKKEFKIGAYTLTGKQLKEAIQKHQDELIDKEQLGHNEIVGYTPKIQAVIAKENSLAEVPDELLKFAEENNLPVILM